MEVESCFFSLDSGDEQNTQLFTQLDQLCQAWFILCSILIKCSGGSSKVGSSCRGDVTFHAVNSFIELQWEAAVTLWSCVWVASLQNECKTLN